MLRVRLAMFGEELYIVLFKPVVILESPEEPAAGQLIGELVTAIGRGDLLQERIASKSDVEPTASCQHGHRQKVVFPLTALQFRSRYADAFTKSQKESSMSRHAAGRTFEILVTHFGLNDFNKLFMNLGREFLTIGTAPASPY